MSGEVAGNGAAEVPRLIEEFCQSLEMDGYKFEWEIDAERNVLNGRVVAGQGACEECLVPRELLAEMLRTAIEPSGIGVGEVLLPRDRV